MEENSFELIQKLKRGNQPSGSFLEIKTAMNSKVYLRPVRKNKEDASKMAEWRSRYFQSFFSWIKPSTSDVLKWLKLYEKDDSDILFFVEVNNCFSVGQMALYDIDLQNQQAEFGRVIQGENVGIKSIMTFAATKLFEWAFNSLGLEKIFLEVFSNNKPAISLYKRLGFKIQNTCYFKKTLNQEGIVRWVAVKEKTKDFESSNFKYRKVHKMVLTKATFNSVVKSNFMVEKISN